MLKKCCIINSKIEEIENESSNILIYSNPTEEEKKELIEIYKIKDEQDKQQIVIRQILHNILNDILKA